MKGKRINQFNTPTKDGRLGKMKYQIREVDYPRKGYFAEFRMFWMWWPMHISMRYSRKECEDIIERDKKAWI